MCDEPCLFDSSCLCDKRLPQALPRDARVCLHALLRVWLGLEVVRGYFFFAEICPGPTFEADVGETRTCCVCEKAGPCAFLRALAATNFAVGGEEGLRGDEAPSQGGTPSRREAKVRSSLCVSVYFGHGPNTHACEVGECFEEGRQSLQLPPHQALPVRGAEMFVLPLFRVTLDMDLRARQRTRASPLRPALPRRSTDWVVFGPDASCALGRSDARLRVLEALRAGVEELGALKSSIGGFGATA